MNKLIVFFIGVYAIGQIISSTVDGDPSIASTQLSSFLADDEIAQMSVSSTTSFLDADYVLIDDEIICYTSKTATTFITLTRGCKGTDSTNHLAGAQVYNETIGVLNKTIGFGLAETLSAAGPFSVLWELPGFFGTSIPRLIAWDYSFFQGDLFGFPLVYIQLIGWVISAGLIITIAITFVNVFMSVFRR